MITTATFGAPIPRQLTMSRPIQNISRTRPPQSLTCPTQLPRPGLSLSVLQGGRPKTAATALKANGTRPSARRKKRWATSSGMRASSSRGESRTLKARLKRQRDNWPTWERASVTECKVRSAELRQRSREIGQSSNDMRTCMTRARADSVAWSSIWTSKLLPLSISDADTRDEGPSPKRNGLQEPPERDAGITRPQTEA